MLNFNNILLSSMPLAITSMKTSVGELQRNYLYQVVVEQYPLSLNAAFKRAPALSRAVDLYLVKGIWPNRKTSNIAVKWSGETFYHSGVDESQKTGQLNFRLSEDMGIKDFWEAAKDLTGDLGSHAAVQKPFQTLTLGVYMTDVDKTTVTDYRRLVDVLVYSVDSIELGKDSDNLVTFNVDISWDRQERDDSRRGKSI
jgi:hypothetical protein